MRKAPFTSLSRTNTCMQLDRLSLDRKNLRLPYRAKLCAHRHADEGSSVAGSDTRALGRAQKYHRPEEHTSTIRIYLSGCARNPLSPGLQVAIEGACAGFCRGRGSAGTLNNQRVPG